MHAFQIDVGTSNTMDYLMSRLDIKNSIKA